MAITTLFSATSNRLLLLSEHFRETHASRTDFLPESFLSDEYGKSLQLFVLQIQEFFNEHYTTRSGRNLIKDKSVEILLEEDYEFANAVVIPQADGGVEVVLTSGLFLAIDIVTSIMISHSVMDENTFRCTHLSKTLSGVLGGIFSSNFTKFLGNNFGSFLRGIAEARLCHFLSSPDEHDSKWFARQCTLSLLWVLTHELGHFLCGHAEYFKKKKQKLGMAERDDPRTDSKSCRHEEKQEIEKRRSAELMADMYATFRLFIFISRGIEKQEWGEDLTESQFIAIGCYASSAPIVLFLLGESLDEGLNDSSDNYPSSLVRVVNVFLCTHFFLNPGTHIVNINTSGESDFIYGKYYGKEPNTSRMVSSVAWVFEDLASLLRTYKLFNWNNSDRKQNVETLLSSLIASRMGCVSFHLPEETSQELIFHISYLLVSWWRDFDSLRAHFEASFKKYVSDETIVHITNLYSETNPLVVEVNCTGGLYEAKALQRDAYDFCPAFRLIDDWLLIEQMRRQDGTIKDVAATSRNMGEFLAPFYLEWSKHFPVNTKLR